MSNDLSKKYVVTIDTNIFHSVGYNFNSPKIYELRKIRDRNIKIILSDIIYNEMIKNFEKNKRIDEQIKQLGGLVAFAGNNNILSKDLQISIKNELNSCNHIEIARRKIDDFCNEYSIEIINTSKLVDMQSILDMYVKSIAPFEKNKDKSSEFQDAISLVGLTNWAKEQNYEILAASNDNGWKDYAHSLKIIKVFNDISLIAEHLLFLENKQRELKRLKEKLLKFIDRNYDLISGIIESDVENYGLYPLADSHYYYEVEDGYITYINHTFDNEKIVITEIDQDYFDVSVSVNINYEANATFLFEMKDGIDGDYISMGNSMEIIEVNDDFDFFMRFHLDENTEITDCELSNSKSHHAILEVDFGWVEPNWDY